MPITMRLAAFMLCLVAFPSALFPQVMRQRTPQDDFSKEAYVLEMLHTRVRFEADGAGSREMTGRIRVQSEAAIHDLGLLRFSYASTFESINIDYVRVRKPDGTVVVTPASDVQEVDSEVSRQAPMYTDQREKHIAVKALGSGDVLEYHIVWTVHDAVAPGISGSATILFEMLSAWTSKSTWTFRRICRLNFQAERLRRRSRMKVRAECIRCTTRIWFV
jgi:hypothetical protein